MEFWGVEVKPGEPLRVQPQYGKVVHISQAALGEVKDVKGAKHVPLRLKVGTKSFIIGSLSAEERTQLMFDLVFEKEFELSHDWKNGSVYFLGYTGYDPASDEEVFSDESEDEQADTQEDGEVKPKLGDAKAADKNVIADAKAGKDVEQSDSDEDEDDSDSDSDDGVAQEDSSDVSGDESEEDTNGSASEEEPPKVPQSKKRAAETARETPVAAKKAKLATPEKTGNKQVHIATPFPSKAAGKASAGNNPQSKAKRSRQ